MIFINFNKDNMCFRENLISSAEENTIEVCKKFHTRKLLAELNRVRVNMSMMEFRFIDATPDDKHDWVILSKYKKVLKTVLSTREHIPNKKESKKIRQEKAKQKK